MVSIRSDLKYILLYALIISAFFLQLPLSGSFPGDLDTWANLGMYKDLGNHIKALFGGSPIGSSNYPCQHTWILFGLDFFAGIIFLFFKLFGFSDLWSYYLFITSVFVLNSYSIFKICSLYPGNKAGNFLAGLFFSISNFMLGNIDNPNIVLTFPGFLSIYFFISAVIRKSPDRLGVSMMMLALQVVLAPIPFLLFSVAWCLCVIIYWREIAQLLKDYKMPLVSAVILLLALSPLFYNYIISPTTTSNFNFINSKDISPFVSMNLDDFITPLPDNIIFPHLNPGNWLSILKSGYPGISLLLVVFYSFSPIRSNIFPKLMVLAGLIISMGPYISVHHYKIFPSPMKLIYDILPVTDYFRLPCRAFFLSIGGLMILFSIGWSKMVQNKSLFIRLIAFALPVLYIAENMPVPLKKYRVEEIFKGAGELQHTVQKLPHKTILNLPSALFHETDKREYIYMYYQTMNLKNTVNGALLYFPSVRLVNDSLCKNVTQRTALKTLLEKNGIDLVIYHSDLALSQEAVILDSLRNSPLLFPIDTTGPKKIFGVVNSLPGPGI